MQEQTPLLSNFNAYAITVTGELLPVHVDLSKRSKEVKRFVVSKYEDIKIGKGLYLYYGTTGGVCDNRMNALLETYLPSLGARGKALIVSKDKLPEAKEIHKLLDDTEKYTAKVWKHMKSFGFDS